MGKQRRQYTADFKFQVALEAARGTKAVSQIASEYGVHLFGANYTYTPCTCTPSGAPLRSAACATG